MRSAEPGRKALLQAGQALLGEADLAKLSVNAIVARASMAKGSFYQHWSSRGDYVRALHHVFHEELFAHVLDTVSGMAPGIERLTAGMHAYLDGCLAQPATKALLIQARSEAGLGEQVAARNRQAAVLITDDLAAAGWDDPEPVATLVVAAIADIALAELTASQNLPELRAALVRLAIGRRSTG
ncbi:TetR/AcrR family transcriptional regulator [Nocardia niwae]|uniref:Helix-turn-helix domain-containing protein n=1 Tax=Nocardia niwae TaxID=626084 RepID=A0ABV2XGA2_9NOCA|nr:TetR family transcriptional regulator [Nocardia niwae]